MTRSNTAMLPSSEAGEEGFWKSASTTAGSERRRSISRSSTCTNSAFMDMVSPVIPQDREHGAKSGAAVGVEAGQVHGAIGFGVAHEGLPDEFGTEVFSHEDTDAEVDAEDVGVVPVGGGMEGVDKAVAAPGLLAVLGAHGAEDAEAVGRQEGERAG